MALNSSKNIQIWSRKSSRPWLEPLGSCLESLAVCAVGMLLSLGVKALIQPHNAMGGTLVQQFPFFIFVEVVNLKHIWCLIQPLLFSVKNTNLVMIFAHYS